jgi:hypothetical protein
VGPGQCQPQWLGGDLLDVHEQVAGAHVLRAGAEPAGADLQVRRSLVQWQAMQFVADVGQPEADVRVDGTEAAEQVGHQPGAERLRERDRDRAGLRGDELRHRVQAAAQLPECPVDVRLEHLPGAGQPQRPSGLLKQGRTDLLLEPRQRPRDAGLRDHLQLADLGDGSAVGHLLKPAQYVRVHDP